MIWGGVAARDDLNRWVFPSENVSQVMAPSLSESPPTVSGPGACYGGTFHSPVCGWACVRVLWVDRVH